MATQADAILDLVAGTLPQLGKFKWSDLSTDTLEHVFFRSMFRKERTKFGSGTTIRWSLLTDHNHRAEHVGLYAVDSPSKRDAMKRPEIPWRHSKTDWCIDEHEITMNSGESRIYDIMLEQRTMGMVSYAEIIETAGWSKPVDSTDDTTPYGIPMSVVATSATSTGGFNGGAPSGFTSGYGGITHARHKNWNFQYSKINKTDALPLIREAMVKTVFVAPVEMPTYEFGGEKGLYAKYSVQQAIETVAEQQNENLGKDVASMDGKTVIRKIPVTYVPYLDNVSAGLIYGLDWRFLKVVFLSGWYMKQTSPIRSPTQHNVIVVYVDTSWNLVNYNRRRHWVGTT